MMTARLYVPSLIYNQKNAMCIISKNREYMLQLSNIKNPIWYSNYFISGKWCYLMKTSKRDLRPIPTPN